MKEFIKVFKALSDETRLRIMKILISANTELCVCEIVDTLGIPFYNISKHLKELKNANMVYEKKDGRFIFYGINSNHNIFLKKMSELIMCEINDPIFSGDNIKLQEILKGRDIGSKVNINSEKKLLN